MVKCAASLFLRHSQHVQHKPIALAVGQFAVHARIQYDDFAILLKEDVTGMKISMEKAIGDEHFHFHLDNTFIELFPFRNREVV